MSTLSSRNGRRSRTVVDEFIDVVVAEMERQGITYSELARSAGVGRPYLYRVLAKEQTPSFEWAEKVATILRIQISFKKVG